MLLACEPGWICMSVTGINQPIRTPQLHFLLPLLCTGSGNPAEGELRPQLLDRFGTSVNVTTLMDTASRTQMVLDRMAYDMVRCAALGRAGGGGGGAGEGAWRDRRGTPASVWRDASTLNGPPHANSHTLPQHPRTKQRLQLPRLHTRTRTCMHSKHSPVRPGRRTPTSLWRGARATARRCVPSWRRRASCCRRSTAAGTSGSRSGVDGRPDGWGTGVSGQMGVPGRGRVGTQFQKQGHVAQDQLWMEVRMGIVRVCRAVGGGGGGWGTRNQKQGHRAEDQVGVGGWLGQCVCGGGGSEHCSLLEVTTIHAPTTHPLHPTPAPHHPHPPHDFAASSAPCSTLTACAATLCATARSKRTWRTRGGRR